MNDIFNEGEKMKFMALKHLASLCFHDCFEGTTSQVLKENVVIAGGVFVDWWYGKEPKDVDFFILDNPLAKNTVRQVLKEKGYHPKDVEYLKRNSQGAKHVQEVWESIVKEENGYAYQFIFTDCQTRKEVIDDFDFKHCCVSYHMDHLHITRNISNAIRDKHLVINNPKNIMPWRVEKFKHRGFVDPSENTSMTLGEIFARAVQNLKTKNSNAISSI